MRTIIHTDARRTTSAVPGQGRFWTVADDNLLTVYVHLPPVTAAGENESLREQTVHEISKL